MMATVESTLRGSLVPSASAAISIRYIPAQIRLPDRIRPGLQRPPTESLTMRSPNSPSKSLTICVRWTGGFLALAFPSLSKVSTWGRRRQCTAFFACGPPSPGAWF
eukprot:2413150-Amphidinium_carterae.1